LGGSESQTSLLIIVLIFAELEFLTQRWRRYAIFLNACPVPNIHSYEQRPDNRHKAFQNTFLLVSICRDELCDTAK
jgi:hypothetical protein